MIISLIFIQKQGQIEQQQQTIMHKPDIFHYSSYGHHYLPSMVHEKGVEGGTGPLLSGTTSPP